MHADGYHGQARLVIDADRNTVIGFTAVGPDVAELLHAATIAIAGEVWLNRLWHAVPAYPTISEIWLRLLETDGRDHADATPDRTRLRDRRGSRLTIPLTSSPINARRFT